MPRALGCTVPGHLGSAPMGTLTHFSPKLLSMLNMLQVCANTCYMIPYNCRACSSLLQVRNGTRYEGILSEYTFQDHRLSLLLKVVKTLSTSATDGSAAGQQQVRLDHGPVAGLQLHVLGILPQRLSEALSW